MENKWLAIMIIGVAFSFCFSMALYREADAQVDIEASKNGLQQCLEDNRILWKKECIK